MIGGFLGSGKTSSIIRLAQRLQKKRLKVGVVTNDQAEGLVDTGLIASTGKLPVREIAGGCFCCQSNRLVDALDGLSRNEKPDVFLAEPVGSCTDLVATVSIPLEKIYKKTFHLSPYSVVVDPFRLIQTFGLEGTAPAFSANINYIYRKQLEEAEIIVINKIDVISPPRLANVRSHLALEYPDATIYEVSTRKNVGLEPWFETLMTSETNSRRIMDVDYAIYAEGEALLGWYNARIAVASGKRKRLDGDHWLMSAADGIGQLLMAANIEVAHFKLLLQDTADRARWASVNLVRSDGRVERGHKMEESFTEADLLVNLRAEADPETLQAIVRTVLSNLSSDVATQFRHEEAFRPAPPTPIHRIAAV